MTTDTDDRIEHRTGCPAERTEVDVLTRPHGGPVRRKRCIDCGQQTIDGDVPRIEPGTDEFLEAWHNNPRAIYEGLSHEERRDPNLNPLHHLAPSWIPGADKDNTS